MGRGTIATIVATYILGLNNNAMPATITGVVADTSGNPTNATIAFAPLSTPLNNAGRIILTTEKTASAGADGRFSILLEPGNYKVTVGTNSRDSFVISVPDTSATNDWTSLITSEITYSFPVSPVYEEKRLRGVANGYASLDTAGHVPPTQLGDGVSSSASFLRGDGTWTNIAAANIGSGQVSDAEFNTLDGIRQNIQEQIDQRVISLNGSATNLAVNRLTSSAELSFLPTEPPQNPLNATIWNDSKQKSLLLVQNGLFQSPSGFIFTSTNAVTCTNTIAETSIVPAGIGSLVLPANSVSPGRTLIIRMRGIYSSPNTTATVVFKFKVGDCVFTTPSLGYSTLQSNKPVYCECHITFISVGVNGACVFGGQFGSQTFTYVFGSSVNPQNYTLPVDTTQDNQISVTATHNRADVSLTINQLTIQTAF